MFHTCGAVFDIIPDLIECGVDILDPVQTGAEGMSPEALAAFKGRIAFHGGVGTQATLPFGTPDDVEGEVARLIKTLGPHKIIIAPDQDMVGDVPAENITALFNAVKKAGNPA
jgi:uroporphyrinogen decarboxylase